MILREITQLASESQRGVLGTVQLVEHARGRVAKVPSSHEGVRLSRDEYSSRTDCAGMYSLCLTSEVQPFIGSVNYQFLQRLNVRGFCLV